MTDVSTIIVAVLGSVLVILVLLLGFTTVILLRKRRVLCFKNSNSLYSNRELQRRHGRRKRKSNQARRHKKRDHAKRKTKSYDSLRKALMFPKSDPFANKHLENPMVNTEELDVDWTNPAFDEEGARAYDAVVTIQSWYRMIRVRIPYLQLKEATLLAQALFRGRKARSMVPRLKKEKAQRDQLRKKQVGWKKKGTLTSLKYYDVKAFGFAEVEQLYGMNTVRNAAHELRNLYGGKGKMRLKLFISVKGIKLYHFQTMEHFATVRVSTVSFCTLDPKNRKLFAFINRKKRRNFCHVFQANESDAQKMVETMAEAFEVNFRRLEMQRKKTEQERELEVSKASFDRNSQQLEDEVASMLEMAETASSVLLEVSSEEGSLRGSREKLIATPKNLRTKPKSHSSLISSLRAPLQVQTTQIEPFDPSKLDDYFTGIKEGVDNISVSLEQGNLKKKSLEKVVVDGTVEGFV